MAIHPRVFENLLANVEAHERRFAQLARDYRREKRGEKLFFAVDYSELHPLIYHPEADRVEINDYILNAAADRFTLLPASVGEVLSHVEARVPLRSSKQVLEVIRASQAVAAFKDAFSAGEEDPDKLIALYAAAQSELKQTLGALADIIIRGQEYSSLASLGHLLRDVLVPIQGLDQIGPLSEEAKNRARFVRNQLELSRPGETAPNRTDALNFAAAFAFNTQLGQRSNEYLAIYSESWYFIAACRAAPRLQVKGDYLIRDLKYLQYRTRLHGMYTTLDKRLASVSKRRKVCEKLALQLKRHLESADLRPVHALPPLELLDLVRRFEHECEDPFAFRALRRTRDPNRADVKRLGEMVQHEEALDGSVADALSELKASLREMHLQLDTFSPIPIDHEDARTYKANLCRWLGLDESNSETLPPSTDNTMTQQ